MVRVLNQIENRELFNWASNTLLAQTDGAVCNQAFNLFGLNSVLYEQFAEADVAAVIAAALLRDVEFAKATLSEMQRFSSCCSTISVPDQNYRGFILGLLQAVANWAEVQICAYCGKERKEVELCAVPILLYLLRERSSLPPFDISTSGQLSNLIGRIVTTNTVFLLKLFALLSRENLRTAGKLCPSCGSQVINEFVQKVWNRSEPSEHIAAIADVLARREYLF